MVPVLSVPEVSVRSYGRGGVAHSHDFVQLVLPLAGMMDLEVAGQGGLLRRGQGACVTPGQRHDQQALKANRFLVVDLDTATLGDRLLGLWMRRPFLSLSPAAGHLVDYMGSLLTTGRSVDPGALALWLPLLLGAVSPQDGGAEASGRLAPLLRALEADPFQGWTVTDMAGVVAVSPRRLHALFLQDVGQTPLGWLTGLRLARVQHWLAATDLSVAEIAYRAGYADQSALTRALRRHAGLTPAAYRRQERSKQRQS